jgi:hypothetical protein
MPSTALTTEGHLKVRLRLTSPHSLSQFQSKVSHVKTLFLINPSMVIIIINYALLFIHVSISFRGE